MRLQRYDGIAQDDKGVARPQPQEDRPPITWFTDPAGNILSVLPGVTTLATRTMCRKKG